MPDMTQGVPLFLRELGVTRLQARAVEGKSLHGWTWRRQNINARGEVIKDNGIEIFVNTNRTPVCKLVTLLHELIHCLHPDWSEGEVLRDERKVLWWLGIELEDDGKTD